MLESVSVPPELEPLFHTAQQVVAEYFRSLHADPAHGTISVGGQRYILVRAASMSVEFFATIAQLYRDKGQNEAGTVARSLLYDLAYAIGAADARAFHHDLKLKDPLAKLSAGPVHFAHTGWAYVSILPESRPQADDDFVLIYDHPYSFEVAAWLDTKTPADFPVCIMNAGYSAGWCTESFGLPLVAVEISCKAMGDETCRFVMAATNRIEQEIARYLHARPHLRRNTTAYEIPGFFQRKQAEDALRDREAQYRSIIESISDGMLVVGLNGRIVAANPAAERLYARPQAELVGLHLEDITAPASRGLLLDAAAFTTGRVSGEAVAQAADGRLFEVEYRATAFGFQHQPHILVLVNDISERKQAEAERLRLQEQLLRQNNRMREELSLARSVQQALAPTTPPWSSERMPTVLRTVLAGEVQRDMCAYAQLPSGRMLLILGDIASKGVAAALVGALVATSIEQQARDTYTPAALLHALQRQLDAQLRACDTTVALAVVVVDLQQRQIALAGAGMPPAMLLRNQRAEVIALGGVPLGVLTEQTFDEHLISIEPGDRLFLLSDGAIEARNPHGQIFGYRRVTESLEAELFTQIEPCVERIIAVVTAFVGDSEQRDDISVLAIRPVLE